MRTSKWGYRRRCKESTRAGAYLALVLFLASWRTAYTADLGTEFKEGSEIIERHPSVPSRKQTQVFTRDDSVFVFAGRLATSNMGSAAVFNTFPVATQVLNSPSYDNYIVGAAYQHRFRELGYGFVLAGEVGVADRFGHYSICCDSQILSSDIRHSGELWFGPTIRYEFVLFDWLRIAPSLTVGFSLTTNSIGVERERELGYDGSGRILGYLGPEVAFSTINMPELELVFRLQHRSGAGGLIGKLREGYNANVVGARFWF